MRIRSAALNILIVLGCIGAFWGWHAVAANYDYKSLAGTYVLRDGNVLCTLRLNADHTFSETLRSGSRLQTTTGNWRLFGEAGMQLSGSFLNIPRQQLGPSGENYGQFYKTLGIFPYLQLDPDPDGPVLRRKLTVW